jgi:hypothetical protein
VHLDGERGDDALRVDERRIAEVVEAVLLEDLGSRLPPGGGVAEVGHAGALQQLRGQDAKGAQESPARVDHLRAGGRRRKGRGGQDAAH